MSNLTTLGDGEGQVKKAAGLLFAVKPDPNPLFKNPIYELVQRNGESVNLAGSASLCRQINETDVGHFVKCEFKGWGNSANGKFKDIEVLIWNDDPTAEMKAWPRWRECQPMLEPSKKAKPDDSFEDVKKTLDAEDDDLPF